MVVCTHHQLSHVFSIEVLQSNTLCVHRAHRAIRPPTDGRMSIRCTPTHSLSIHPKTAVMVCDHAMWITDYVNGTLNSENKQKNFRLREARQYVTTMLKGILCNENHQENAPFSKAHHPHSAMPATLGNTHIHNLSISTKLFRYEPDLLSPGAFDTMGLMHSDGLQPKYIR